MENRYITSLIAFFALAAIASAVKIFRTGDKAFARELITKYIVYSAIVALMSYVIMADNFTISLAAILVITVISGIELYAAVKNLPAGWLWLIGYMAVAASAIMVFTKLHYTLLLMAYLFVVVFDGMSQTGGQLFGKRKLAPDLSPNKTWEGLISGILFASAALAFTSSATIGTAIQYCIIFSVLALAGDLAGSKIKRLAGLKDFGKTLPGHGGVLDRFDSFLVVLLYFTIVSIYSYAVK